MEGRRDKSRELLPILQDFVSKKIKNKKCDSINSLIFYCPQDSISAIFKKRLMDQWTHRLTDPWTEKASFKKRCLEEVIVVISSVHETL